jgi:hypothetical protein
MAGKTGRSGGRRAGAGAKKKGDLVQLHAMIDLHVDDADWASIIGALVKKAKTGNVYAFRELRACRYGHLPIATEPVEDARPQIDLIEVVRPCSRKHVDEETVRRAGLSSKELATPI